MLDKKQITAIFKFKFKMGGKGAETTHNNAFGPEIANKGTMHWRFKQFYTGGESLEDEEGNGQPLKLIPLQLHRKLLKNSTYTILQSFEIWSKLERWKSSVSGCLMSWPKIKKLSFWSVVFSYSKWIIFRSDCDVQQKVDFMTTNDN